MSETQVKKISLRIKSIPVEIEDDRGEIELCTIRELLGPQRDEYLSFTSAKIEVDEEGNPVGMRDMNGVESKLLSLCMFDGDGKSIPEETIQKWPGSARGELYKMAQDLSGLGKASKDSLKKAKNS